MSRFKDLYNLLSVSTNSPLVLSSTDGNFVYGPSYNVEDAFSGRIYYHAYGFATVTAGIAPSLFFSFNNYSWYESTSLPVLSTGNSYLIELSNLGKYIKLGWKVNAEHIDNVRAMLEADSEY